MLDRRVLDLRPPFCLDSERRVAELLVRTGGRLRILDGGLDRLGAGVRTAGACGAPARTLFAISLAFLCGSFPPLP